MEAITIEMPETRGMSQEVFNEWKSNAYERIGWLHGGYLFTGNPENRTWYFAWVEGHLYRKQDGKHFFRIVHETPTGPPHIVCSCGGAAFSLRYKDYGIRALCTQCQLEEDVYSE